MKNTLTPASRSSIVATIFAMAIITPIIENSNDTYIGAWCNDTLAIVPTKALCIFSKEERQLIAANVEVMKRKIEYQGQVIERAVIIKDILGIERNDAEVFVMSRSRLWRGTEKRYAMLQYDFVWDPLPYTKDTLEYVRHIVETREGPVRKKLQDDRQRKIRDAMDFSPYEEKTPTPVSVEDDGSFCYSSESEPDFAGIPENDGSFTTDHPDRIVLPTGQTLVKIKYRSRTRYILLDEGFVSEDTTLPEIVGDLERQALHLGVNIWTDRLQRLRDIRKVMVERWLNDEPIGAADLVVAMNNEHPYHIVYSDLRLIRKIKWPDGLVI